MFLEIKVRFYRFISPPPPPFILGPGETDFFVIEYLLFGPALINILAYFLIIAYVVFPEGR